MMAQFKIPEKGCANKAVPDKRTIRCPFFDLDVAGGTWSCKCVLSHMYAVSRGRLMIMMLDINTYHDVRPADCPFDTYPNTLELSAKLTGDSP